MFGKQSKNTQNVGDAPLLPITRLIPNLFTIAGLCFGLFAIKYAMVERWETAVMLIVIAAFIDGLDGRIARFLNASSEFGAQLDSLTDFLNFGVAPALLLYMWMTHEIKGLGWAIALFFVICQALRLARFGSNEAEDVDPETKRIEEKFFVGVPAPVGAGLTLLPMIITFLFNEKLDTPPFYMQPIGVIIYMAVIALMMISRIPTLSVKKMKIKREYTTLILAIAGLFIVGLIVEPWIVLPLMGVGYLLTVPISMVAHYKVKHAR